MAERSQTRSSVRDSDDSQSEPDDSGSGSGSEDRENGFFDDEALESAEEAEEGYSSDEEEIDPFPFTRLPPELRIRVWHMFCPDLLGAPRVLDLGISQQYFRTENSPQGAVGANFCLEDQTQVLRCLFAVNSESRALAKQKYPDEIVVRSDNGEEFTLCVNLKSDVMMLSGIPYTGPAQSDPWVPLNFDGFSQGIINLALPFRDAYAYPDSDVTSWLRKFTSLERVFFYMDEDELMHGLRFKDDALRWCASPACHQYAMETFEKDYDYGEDYTKLVCWPDSKMHPAFAQIYVPRWHTRILPRAQKIAFDDANVELLPMIVFQTQMGLERFDGFFAMRYLPLKEYDYDSDDSDAEDEFEDAENDYEIDTFAAGVNDYESDGIDDDEPETFHESGDEHLDDGDSDDGSAAPNRFSSPEPSADEGGPRARGRKRRVVSDSDDEDDEPSTRPAKRSRVHVLQDSDDEDETNGAISNDQSHAQVISSDSDAAESAPNRRRRVERVVSDEDDEEDTEADSESEAEQPQRVSLVDRLQARTINGLPPVLYENIAQDEDEDEEDEDEEEEEEEEEDDEDDDDDEDGFLDRMAAESGEDEEDEEEEEEEEDDE